MCSTSARRFQDYGKPVRPEARCPSCGSLERDRAVWSYLAERTDWLERRTRVLHVAPERSLERKLRERFGQAYLTADLSRSDVSLTLDICDIPFKDDVFDLLLCSHVLEHVDDDRLAMRELYRVLAPGGVALLQVPINAERTDEDPSVTDSRERERRFGQHDHVRSYGPDVIGRLEEAGFAVEELIVRDLFSAQRIARQRMDPATRLHVCRKAVTS